MSAARRLPLIAFAALAPLAVLACGGDSKAPDSTTTTTAAGASTPVARTVSQPVTTTPVVVTYADADSAYRSGQYGDAVRLFSAYGERHPGNAGAQYMIGLAEWKAGDLMLSAPGWAVHNHASYDDFVYELTVQDQPLNIAMESLLWQESLKLPLAVLGVQEGFGTNRAAG